MYKKVLSSIIIVFTIVVENFSQYSFQSLDSIIDRCSLDSTLYYLKRQSKLALTKENKFTNKVNYGSYYRTIHKYDSAFLLLNEGLYILSSRRCKGIVEQRRGLIYTNMHDYNNAKQHYLLALNLFSDSLNLAATCFSLYDVYADMGEMDSSKYYLFKSKEIYEKSEVKKRNYGTVLNSVGIMYYHEARYDSAYFYFLESLELYNKYKDNFNIARTKDLIGTLFYRQNNYKKAIVYYMESYKDYSELKDIKGQVSRLANIGAAYKDMGKVDSAIYYYNKVYRISHESNLSYLESVSLSNMATIDAENGNFRLAIRKQKNSLEIDKRNNDKEGVAIGNFNLGDFYSAMGKKGLAIKKFKKSCDLSKDIKRVEIIKECYNKLSLLYEGWKNDSSFFYYKEYIKLKDSIGSLEVKKSIESLNIRYRNKVEAAENIQLKLEVDKKEKQLLIENQRLEIEKGEKKNIYAIAMLIVLLLLFFTYSLYIRNRSHKKEVEFSKMKMKQEILEKQNILDRLEQTQRLIIEKNKTIEKFDKYLDSPEASQQLLVNLSTDKDWAKFIIDFELLYPNYFSSLLLQPECTLTKNDYRIAALFHLKLSNKEMVEILNITLSGVKNAKTRFKSKLI